MKSHKHIAEPRLKPSLSDVGSLQKENAKLKQKAQHLQLDWFKRQLKELIKVPKQTTAAYQKKKKLRDVGVSETGVRFDESVPAQVVNIRPKELKGKDADRYEIISYKLTYQLV